MSTKREIPFLAEAKITHVIHNRVGYLIVKAWFGRGVGYGFTFNNISVISWRSVLLVEETRVPRENHWPVASHWQTLLHNVVSSTAEWLRSLTPDHKHNNLESVMVFCTSDQIFTYIE